MKTGVTVSNQKRIDNAVQEILAETEVAPISEVNVDQLQPYPQHPFKLYEGERLQHMIESIKLDGVIHPIVVRRLDDGTLQILAGHNRINAARLVGLSTVPARILDDVDDVTAKRIVYSTNFIQRTISEMPHSEAAALVSRAKASLTFLGWRGKSKEGYRSREIVADKYGLTQSKLDIYLRIDLLIEDLKPFVDDSRIPLTAAVDISHISYAHQAFIAELLRENPGLEISCINAEYFRTMDKKGKLTPELIKEILLGIEDEPITEDDDSPPKRRCSVPKGMSITLPPDIVQRYFKGQGKAQVREQVIDAIVAYFVVRRD